MRLALRDTLVKMAALPPTWLMGNPLWFWNFETEKNNEQGV
jgi:hypothetical protein